MVLLQIQFGRVLDGDDPLAVRNVGGKRVKHGRLARAGAARNNDVERAMDARLEKHGHALGERPKGDQFLHRQRALAEFTDGDRRAVERQRRNDDVDARTVGQPRVAKRARLVLSLIHILFGSGRVTWEVGVPVMTP